MLNSIIWQQCRS